MPNPSGSVAPLLGRILICWIFIYSAWGQIVEFNFWAGRATQAGLPLGHVAIIASITIQMLGGIAVLLGAEARIAGWALFLFLIPTTLTFHQFWKLSGAAATPQINNFNRNIAIMGGLLFIATFGAGAYSVDALLAARRSRS
jgi:putative oxidoreductase